MRYKKEALHYLGYHGQEISPDLNKLIEECLAEAKQLANPRHVIQKFKLNHNDELTIKPSNLNLSGESIKEHLANCSSCYLIGVTLGQQLDQKIRYYELNYLTKATILDACSSAYIEMICDEVSAKLANIESKNNKFTTSRFSPGYGDLPLSLQSSIIKALEADKRIGLSNNRHDLLLPRKSVTAIIGVKDNCEYNEVSKCEICNMKDCKFRENVKS